MVFSPAAESGCMLTVWRSETAWISAQCHSLVLFSDEPGLQRACWQTLANSISDQHGDAQTLPLPVGAHDKPKRINKMPKTLLDKLLDA